MPTTINTAPTFDSSYTFGEHESVPAIIPTAPENLVGTDVWIREITLTNKTASDATVSLTDRQGTPMEVLASVNVQANQTYVIRFDTRYCPGGITWWASASDSIVGYIRWKK